MSGHYPIYSTGEHGGFRCLGRLDRLLRKQSVNAYFSGHEHNLQHIQLKIANNYVGGTDNQGSMNYIISGAASRTDRSFKHENDVPSDAILLRDPKGWNPFSQMGFSNGRFIHVRIGNKEARLNFYSGKGDRILYHTSINPRKTRK